MAACRRVSALGQGAMPPNFSLAPQMWHETLFDEPKASAYTGRCKKSVIWPLKFAKMHYRPGLCLRLSWRSSWCSPRLWSVGEGTPLTYPTPLGTRFSCLWRLSHMPGYFGGIAPKYFSLEPCLAAWWRWARCPVCKNLEPLSARLVLLIHHTNAQGQPPHCVGHFFIIS